MKHARTITCAIVVATLVAACDSPRAGVGCASEPALENMIYHSGFLVEDRVRGVSVPEGFVIEIVGAKRIESLPDRTVCSADFRISGPRAALVKHVLNSTWTDDQTFLLSETIAGYDNREPSGGDIQSVLKDGVRAMALTLEIGKLSPDIDKGETTISSPIEYSIEKGVSRVIAPMGWAWSVSKQTPGYQAGRHLAELTLLARGVGL